MIHPFVAGLLLSAAGAPAAAGAPTNGRELALLLTLALLIVLLGIGLATARDYIREMRGDTRND